MALETRLSLLLCALLTLAFGVFGWLEQSALERSVLGDVDQNLRIQASELARLFHEGRLHPEDLTPLQQATPTASVFLEVQTPEGRPLFRSDSSRNVSFAPEQGLQGFSTVRLEGGERVRVYRGEVAGNILILEESLQFLDEGVTQTAWHAFWLGSGLLVAVLLGCRWLVRQALRPLRGLESLSLEMTRTGTLPPSFVLPPGGREVDNVARAIHDLLTRVHEVVQAQKRLLEDTSHELRNPLTVLSTDLGLLEKELDAETRAEVAQEALAEVQRLTRLVQDLLLISWAEARPELRLQHLMVETVAGLALERTRPQAGRRTLSLAGSGQALVQADPDRLLQILRNLLDNAVRATGEEGKITIWMGALPDELSIPRAEGQVLVVVQDDGVGLEEGDLTRIFERFTRVDTARSRALGGSGLGLPLARALARAMGGDLSVSSRPGRGSSFILSLRSA